LLVSVGYRAIRNIFKVEVWNNVHHLQKRIPSLPSAEQQGEYQRTSARWYTMRIFGSLSTQGRWPIFINQVAAVKEHDLTWHCRAHVHRWCRQHIRSQSEIQTARWKQLRR
jgi:hypothetical protein